jgi:glycosyltransferase involved in cell wall biosynthesis
MEYSCGIGLLSPNVSRLPGASRPRLGQFRPWFSCVKLAISSTAGDPLDPQTWSAAPANLAGALGRRGIEIAAIDSSVFTHLGKVSFVHSALARGMPPNAVSWTEAVRRRRGAFVAAQTLKRGASHVLCAGSLDVPRGRGVPYSIWMDNTWHLLCDGRTAPRWATGAALDYVDGLERKALQDASSVLTFSEHVRDDVISHYGVTAERAFAVGCGSGDLPPFEGEKRYHQGHLLFVAKHLFAEKGGEIVIEAFELIRARRPRTRLVVVGSDAVIARLRGRPGVEAHGFVSRETLKGLFHGAAMLVQPMLADPWGQVYLEAMKARAIVVSLRVAALPELTENGRLGVLVDEPAPERIAGAVLETYARPEAEIDAMARCAQERALRLYSWDKVADRVVAALMSPGLGRRMAS